MRWAYTIGQVAGTAVKVHATFLLLPAYWGYVGYLEGGLSTAVARALFILGLFVCVLLHEFGHILTARRFGIRTPDVILLPIGGVARLERIPDDPKQELRIALGGPAVTLAIAVLLYLGILVTNGNPTLRNPEIGPQPFATQLMWANVVLLAFNLIPAFPMDGGRVLRSLLARKLGLVRGTRIAATLGQGLAVAGGLYAFSEQLPLLVLVAVFVFIGAGTEATSVETRVAGQGLQVQQMMVTDFRTIPVFATLAQAAELLLAGEQREFPVVDNLGRTEGLLTRDDLIRGLSIRGAGSSVQEAMTASAPTVPPTLPFADAMERLRTSGLPALPVVDGRGMLVGLLTRDNIADLLLIRRARG